MILRNILQSTKQSGLLLYLHTFYYYHSTSSWFGLELATLQTQLNISDVTIKQLRLRPVKPEYFLVLAWAEHRKHQSEENIKLRLFN